MKYCTRCQAVCEDYEVLIHIEPDVNWATEICPNCNADGELEPLDADWVSEYLSVLRLKHPTLTVCENWLGEHVSLGPVTIYGANAMHWGVQIRFSTGYLCLRLPFTCFGDWWPLYLYFSPNATPQAATWWGWGRKTHGRNA